MSKFLAQIVIVITSIPWIHNLSKLGSICEGLIGRDVQYVFFDYGDRFFSRKNWSDN
ncbi:MAG: hypothetical protein O4751_02305 [Trichodesmium sp. St2_bin6]|nr:hypothetical protein [Trichodesmium sp. MAG_R01]MDE5068741.1 hypothetical protein [Trichodesmium sp. St4_bin8_1]MDE5071137.1 hypothetical protein [Trichodesmium sp. St5_bin8]MDE5077149.1 hypothetical protein [Trichodesmium sp. St2_bin6]MDE5092138.1 hypothetical protein [Trichodesmium sp. St18_bin3_1_1]MDE5102483.1 hypothetical protein [Trichodesmium sp. St19_bin2]